MINFKVYILCFPRVASRYFQAILDSKLGHGQVCKTHNMDINSRGKKIVGLIRDPLDQISSSMTQGFEFSEILIDGFRSQEERIIAQVPRAVKRYCAIMDAILARSSVIFDYDFFTSSPEIAATVVLNILGEESLDLEPIIPGTSRDEGMRYMKSSKESEQYDFIRSIIETQDISAAEAKYQELLAEAYKPGSQDHA